MKKGFSTLSKSSKSVLSGFFRSGLLNQYKYLLVIGGSNPLGNSIISTFSETWKIANIDFAENKDAHLNILLNKGQNLTEDIGSIEESLEPFSKQFDTIVCVNEGWIKGSVKDQDIFAQFK